MSILVSTFMNPEDGSMGTLVLLSEWRKSQIEFWRPSSVDGYDISSFGRLRSWWYREKQGTFRNWKTLKGNVYRLLKPSITNGTYKVDLHTPTGIKYCHIHRLVAEAFIPNPENKPFINHINLNRLDCHVDNLEWVTPKENTKHANLNGRIQQGTSHHRAKFTAYQIGYIRTSKDTPSKLGLLFGCSASSICDIRAYRSYKDVK